MVDGFLNTNDSPRVTTDDEVESKYFQSTRNIHILSRSTTPLREHTPHELTVGEDTQIIFRDPTLPANLSSDSPLSDVSNGSDFEDDIEVKPSIHVFSPTPTSPLSDGSLDQASTHSLAILSPETSPYFEFRATTSPPRTPIKKTSSLQLEATKPLRPKLPKVSPYFPKSTADPESCLPFPPIDTPSFGLVQEQLAHEPYKLLIATIFLNRTRGGVALPVLFKVFERYPTIDAMANADQGELVDMIHCLGFQNQRANKCITLAQTWQTATPSKNKRYRKLHYPRKLDGRDIPRDECVDDEDHRSGWEVAHLPGVGAYSLDSWRIFCRDELRGAAMDWKGTGATNPAFVPEWKSVLPMDKELRAYLTWMWLKEGWIWDYRTGDLKPATEKTLRAARTGGVAHETDGNWVLQTSPVKAANGLHEEDQ